MANIGLIDIDSHNFPNLCLMKISAYHKEKGDAVFLLKPADVLKGSDLFTEYDRFYGACVFTGQEKIVNALKEVGVIVGGSGTAEKTTLPHEIEHAMPDYSLYGIENEAYGFLTRGCPRGCPFCIVATKEGKESRKVADLAEFWGGQRFIKLLDPNLLACADHMELLRQLHESGAWVDFTQGLDVRLLTEENTEAIGALKIKRLHFAWDNPHDKTTRAALKAFRAKTEIKDHRKLIVYVLCNFWSSPKEDLYRVEWLKGNGYDPYVMIYDKKHAPRETRLLQRWVNNKRIFNSTETFAEFDPRRG